MKKSTIGLLIVIQVLLLFIFENTYSLFKQMEKKEFEAILGKSDLIAEQYVRLYATDIAPMRRQGYFKDIVRLEQSVSSRSVQRSGKEEVYIIQIPVAEKASLLFSKSIHSANLFSLRNLKKLFSGLAILLGVSLLLSGLVLIIRIKKDKGSKEQPPLPPLQNYLVELKNVQEELKDIVSEQNKSFGKKEELNKSIVNNLHLAVIFVNPAERVEIFNPAAQRIFGRTYTIAQNNQLQTVLDEYPQTYRFLHQARTRESGEIDENQRIFLVDLIPVKDTGKLALIRDVTQDKKRERIQHINSNLIMLGEMTASLAHETKNSLGVILGYTRTLKADEQKTRKITQEIRFLSAMMENFLNFAKPVEKVDRQPVDLKKMLQNIAAANAIAVRVPAGEMSIKSDPVLLNMIFSNLLLNSRQAGAQTVGVDFTLSGEQVEIRIHDDGRGIAENIRDKIWLPFFSAREKGTGMGLPIVKKLVNALGGEIRLLQSDSGKTSFRLSFDR